IMGRLEKLFFPSSSSKVVAKLRRPCCMLLSVVLLLGILSFVVGIISVEMAQAFPAIINGAAGMIQSLQEWLSNSGMLDKIDEWALPLALPESGGSWQETVKALINKLGGMGGIASTVFVAGKSVGGIAVNAVVAIVFALYLLVGKEHALKGARTLVRWVFPPQIAQRIYHAGRVANECFSQFIMGQCLEGIILGTLCGLGMKLLGLPYALAVGACVGLTSLIPLVGAWIGASVGVLMIFSVEPIQAVWFVIFLLILQQIEGNLIYPFVVGSSVGVPGIWVLVAIFVGGALFGIVGILAGVPVVATIRRLVADWRPDKDEQSQDPPQPELQAPAAAPQPE
ncbi:MAG: AI-2E family transporter, partial [Coriobacteriales bacterium]|nr:AI-2E family transporter [Coriobacteriales bacterium]